MEYSPPPLFKQGASARAKVVFFAIIAIALLVIDARMNALAMIRQGVGILLYPVQVAALMPRDAAYAVGGYFSSLSTLQKENEQLKRERVANAQTLQQGQYLLAENAQLRALLAAAERVPVKSVMSEILYDTRDAFTRKIVVNRGAHHGVTPGQPVIDDIGVVGQITRVFPLTSEVTLLTDKDFAIPVQVVRSGVRSIAYGRGQSGVLDLRFMPTNADIQKGDVLVTTGIDGVYPPGLAVATVTEVESKSSDAFARILCQPSAGIGRNMQLLILMPEAKHVPNPALGEANDKAVKKVPDAAKQPAKQAPALEVKTETPPLPGQQATVKNVSAGTAAPAAAKPKPTAPKPAAPAQTISKPPVPTSPAPVPAASRPPVSNNPVASPTTASARTASPAVKPAAPSQAAPGQVAATSASGAGNRTAVQAPTPPKTTDPRQNSLAQ